MQIKNGKYLENYQRDLLLKNYAENTIENYGCQIELFLKHFNAAQPKDINL